MSTHPAAVLVRDLRKHYGQTPVLDGLSFTVERGEIFALLGPNGAGKTTTVEILEGFRTADAGTVSVLGRDPRGDAAQLRARVGVMLQEGGLPPGMRAGELLGLGAAFFREPMTVNDALALVGLDDQRRSLIRNLSGGQRQRLSLGLALIGRPELVFLDEPTTGMDAGARRTTWGLIRDLAAAGVTVVLTTHYLAEAETLADRVAIIDHGKLLALDLPSALSRAGEHRDLFFNTVAPIDVEALAAALGKSVTSTEGGYRVDGEPTPELVAALTAWLAARDVLVSELRAARPSLEETFLHLTGDGES